MTDDRPATPDPGAIPAEGPGTVLGRYRILEVLGQGGFGTVYRAEQSEPVRRRVALKILKLGMDTREVVARFQAERQALARMDHPSIAKVHDAGATTTGRPYFVMELVEGVPITTFCDEERLPTRERLALFRQVCLAVQHAHQKGVLHRDLKPSNVLVARVDGKPLPKVIDFGIAKAIEEPLTDSSLATRALQIIGTPEYMAPEQSSGSDVDTRADVYSLGIVLYELLTGASPFVRTTGGLDELNRLLHQIREVTPPRPSTRVGELGPKASEVAARHAVPVTAFARSLRGDLDWIVMKALEKDRDRRYATALELADDLARHLANEPVLASPPGAGYRLRKFVRRNRLLVAASAVVAATVLAAAGMLAFGYVVVRDERDLARQARQSEKAAREAAEVALVQAEAARREEARAREAEASARADAEESLAESDEVTRFLEDMLGAVDPGREGLDVTVRRVLDRAALDVAARFAERPRVHARLERTIGATYVALGLYDAAEPHLETAAEVMRAVYAPGDPQTAEMLHDLGELRLRQRRFEESERIFREWRELSVAAGHTVDAANAGGALGYLYELMGRFDDAEREIQGAIDAIRAAEGEGSPLLVSHLMNLGVLYDKTDRPAEAEAIAEEVHALCLARYGPEHPRTLIARSNRVKFLRGHGRVGEAAEEARAILEVSRRVNGPDHPDTVHALSTVANDAMNGGRYEEAAALFRESIDGMRAVHGDRHAKVGREERHLGLALWQAGRLDEAETVLERARAVLDETLGRAHPDTCEAQNLLAIVHYLQGRHEDALASWEALLEVQSGNADPGGAFNTRMNIAMVQGDLGRHAEAEASYVECLARLAERGDRESDACQNTMNNLAVLYVKMGHLDEAARLADELIETRTRLRGPDHPLTMGTLGILGAVYMEQGRDAEATLLQRDLLERRRRALGPEHPDVATALYAIGLCLHRLGRPEDAEESEAALREALALNARMRGPDASETSNARHVLGSLLADRDRPDEAEPLLRAAWESRARTLGPDHDETLDAALSLARALDALGRDEEARSLADTVIEARTRAARRPDASAKDLAACADALLTAPGAARDVQAALGFARAASERPGGASPDILATLAHALAQSGETEEASSVARRALELMPEGATEREDLRALARGDEPDARR